MAELMHALTIARAQGCEAKISNDQLPQDVSNAYAQLLPGATGAVAWKIGGANPWSRAVFNNTEVFLGR